MLGWTAVGGIGMVAVWETLELTQVVVRGRAVYDDVFLVLLLFLVGSALGVAHGSVLAYLGRADERSPREALGILARALIGTAPMGLLAFAVASWVSLTTVALQNDRGSLWILAGLGWLVAAVLWGYVGHESVAAVRSAYRRWTGGGMGVVGVGLAFIAVLVLWLLRTSGGGAPPEVDVVGALLIAFLATVWVGIPLITLITLAASRTRTKGRG